MGWRLPPDERQKHRVIIEISGPVNKTKWARYRAAVKGVARKYGARIADKARVRKATRTRRKRKG